MCVVVPLMEVMGGAVVTVEVIEIVMTIVRMRMTS
jgi:hypothetical protein